MTDKMTTHLHTAIETRALVGTTLDSCHCGARKRSDGKAIDGAVLSVGGWYVAAPSNERREAIERLNSEGYSDGPEAMDAEDEFFAGRE